MDNEFFENLDKKDFITYAKEAIGQMVVLPYPNIKISVLEELSETERGSSAFGSTSN